MSMIGATKSAVERPHIYAFHSRMATLTLIRDFAIPSECIQTALDAVGKALNSQTWASYHSRLQSTRESLTQYRSLIQRHQREYDQWRKKEALEIVLPSILQQEYDCMLPVQVGTLEPLKLKVEQMLKKDSNWKYLHFRIKPLKLRIDELMAQQAKGTLIDEQIEWIGLTNLILNVTRPFFQDFSKVSACVELTKAIKEGDFEAARKYIIANPYSVFLQDGNHGSILHFATTHYRPEMMELIIRAGADINPLIYGHSSFGSNSTPPLMAAYAVATQEDARNPHVLISENPYPEAHEKLRKLLTAGADPNISRSYSYRGWRESPCFHSQNLLYDLFNYYGELGAAELMPDLMEAGLDVNAISITGDGSKITLGNLISDACESYEAEDDMFFYPPNHGNSIRELVYNGALFFVPEKDVDEEEEPEENLLLLRFLTIRNTALESFEFLLPESKEYVEALLKAHVFLRADTVLSYLQLSISEMRWLCYRYEVYLKSDTILSFLDMPVPEMLSVCYKYDLISGLQAIKQEADKIEADAKEAVTKKADAEKAEDA